MKKLNTRLKVVVLPLIIFIAAFFFFMQGVDSLRAQEAPEIASQKGWFVGVNPLIFGANKIETKTTVVDTVGELVVGDLTADIRTPFRGTVQVQQIAVDICEGDFAGYDLDRLEIVYLAEDRSDATDLYYEEGGIVKYIRFRLNGEELESLTENPNDIASSSVTASPIDDYACKQAFDGLLLEDKSSTGGSSETSTGKALAGNGLQVGYRDGDYRYSFSNFSWAAGADKLDSQVLLLEYFIAKGFSAGIGVANVKLDSSAGLHSQRANVFSLSYQVPIWKNLFVEASYMLISANISVQKEELKVFEEVNQTDTRELGFYGGNNLRPNTPLLSSASYYETASGVLTDLRTTVKRTQTQTAGSKTTTKSVEIKNPAAFRINFVWRFR